MHTKNNLSVIAATAALLLEARAEASAGCHATDFDAKQIGAVAHEVDAATVNLKALQNLPADPHSAESWLVTLAAQMTDRAAVETALFSGYLAIYGELKHADDRAATDVFIEGIASQLGKTSPADSLRSRAASRS
jgi:hypothetical protein